MNGRSVTQSQRGQNFGKNQHRKNRFVVRANAKEIAFDQKSRSAMQIGIDKLADAVGLTLGPRGNSWKTVISPDSARLTLLKNSANMTSDVELFCIAFILADKSLIRLFLVSINWYVVLIA